MSRPAALPPARSSERHVEVVASRRASPPRARDLPRGGGRRPRGPRRRAQGSSSPSTSSRSNVRFGVANQRVAVRTLRAAEDRGSAASSRPRSASRPRITSRCRSSRRCWTGRWSGTRTGEDGDRQVDVVVVAARRDMVGAVRRALCARGPAPRRDRPLGLRHDPRACDGGSARRRSCRAAARRRGLRGALRRAGRRLRRRTPLRLPHPATLYCNLGDVTNLAVARGSYCLFTRISSFGSRGSPRSSPSAAS